MYSVVLLTALTAGGEVGGHGHGWGSWWYEPLPYIDEVWPVPIRYAPSPSQLAPGGAIGPSLAEALRWIVPAGKPLSADEKQAWADYYNALTPDEQAEVGAIWNRGDFAAQRKLLALVSAMRPKDKEKEKQKDN